MRIGTGVMSPVGLTLNTITTKPPSMYTRANRAILARILILKSMSGPPNGPDKLRRVNAGGLGRA